MTTITVLTPASCYYMASFNYGGKKARDAGFTCRCHLSNIMSDSIIYGSMGRVMTQSFLTGGNRCLPQHRRDGFSLIIITPVGMGKPYGIDYLLMRFQFWSMSEDSRVRILFRGSSVRVCLVVSNQGCCGSGQYNLPDRMLRLDANTTLNQSYVLFITLVNITYQSGDQYFPSIHSWDSSPWQVLYVSLFFLNCLLCSACILQMRNRPNQFLIQIKVYFFPNL